MKRTFARNLRVHPRLLAAGLALTAALTVALVAHQSTSATTKLNLTGWNGGSSPNAWDGSEGDNDWTNGDNWSQGSAPNEDAYYAITIPSNIGGAPVVIENIPELIDAASLTIVNSGTYATQVLTSDSDTTFVLDEATLIGGEFHGVQFNMDGNVTIGDSTNGHVTFDRGGLRTSTSQDLNAGGTLHLENGAGLTISAGAYLSSAGFTVDGDDSGDNLVDFLHGTIISMGGTFTTTANVDLRVGSLENAQPTFSVPVVVNGEAEFVRDLPIDPSYSVTSNVSLALNGDAAINGPIELLGTSAITVGANGSLTVNPGAAAVASASGDVTVNGALDVTTGVFSTAGTFTTGANSTTTVKVNGVGGVAGTDFTKVQVDDNATLSGALRVARGDGFAGNIGATFPVFSFAPGTTGDFTAFGTAPGSAAFDGSYFTKVERASTTQSVSIAQASMAVTPASTNPGGTVTVTGTNFAPNENVFVALGESFGESGGLVKEITVNASASGVVSAAVTIPATATPSTATHRYTVNVNGTTSSAFLQKDVTVVATPGAIDTDGDGIADGVDCAPADKNKPAKGAGVVDKDCNGVNDAIQPVKFIGSKKNDKVTTAGGNDTIKTGAGNDTIMSGAGNDKIDAGIGNDKVDAGAGNDTVAGGSGNDKLAGGTGKDKLSGGPGNDTINAKDKNNGDTIVCGPGKDTVVADKKDKVSKDCEKVKRS